MGKEIRRLSDIVLPAYKEFWHTDKTYVICKGSRGSGKSKQSALWHIWNMRKNSLSNTLVVRKVYRTIKDSCYSDLCWAIEQLGMDDEWRCTLNPLEITRKKTGQKILFRGLDDGMKIASVSVPHGVLNYLWIEELYEIMNEADFDIIDESIRGELPDGYHKRVTATFNPWSEHHFSKKRFFDNPADNVLAMTTTYMDNDRLSEDDFRMFEEMKTRNPRRYQVAGLGDWGVVEGLIYENWHEEEFTLEQIMTAYPDLKDGFGLDFGYTIDPSAGFFGFISKSARKVFVYDELYKKGLSNRALADEIQRMGFAKDQITADSAEPKSIDELRGFGLKRIKGAKKGRDSINNGIQFIQDYEIVIHPRCVNFITEISNYTWQKDKFGKSLNTPVDDFNHLMDAMRYGLEKFITTSSPQIKTIRGGI